VRSGFCCPGEKQWPPIPECETAGLLAPISARVFSGAGSIVLLSLASFLSSARCAEPVASAGVSSGDNALAAITGNPAAENQLPGTGLAGRLIHLPEDFGLRLGGLWLADTNDLLSGGCSTGQMELE
jgi:hypothetical protein